MCVSRAISVIRGSRVDCCDVIGWRCRYIDNRTRQIAILEISSVTNIASKSESRIRIAPYFSRLLLSRSESRGNNYRECVVKCQIFVAMMNTVHKRYYICEYRYRTIRTRNSVPKSSSDLLQEVIFLSKYIVKVRDFIVKRV